MTAVEVEQFVETVVSSPPSRFAEDAGSLSHETRRIPDPYIFIIGRDFLKTPSGQSVESFMMEKSRLDLAELTAFRAIQGWALKSDSGVCLWFSPPTDSAHHPYLNSEEHYPNSKVIISEITTTAEGKKILLNRAVILDVDVAEVLELANRVSADIQFFDPEALRVQPIFPDQPEYFNWLGHLALATSQVDLMTNGQDLVIKWETYASIEDIRTSVAVAGENHFDEYSHARAYQRMADQGLIGKNPGSCPSSKESPFRTVFANSELVSRSDSLDCACPFCHKRVTAVIKGGRIHCPNCAKSAEYSC